MSRRARGFDGAIGALVCCAVLGACTGGSGSPSNSQAPSTRTVTSIGTSPPPGATFTPAPATTVPALRGGKAPKGENFGHCPYISPGLDEDSNPTGPNIAEIEGDRVGRTTLLTGHQPVGCRFYFLYSYGNTRHEAVADILPTTFTTATAAYNAMVLTARAGRSLQSRPHFAPGANGVQYQTKFFGPDRDRDWAFVFAKGKVMVVVHTQQNDSQANAYLIGKAIVGKF